jgi:hypothetical protein
MNISKLLLISAAALALSAVAMAAPITVNFTYTGVATFVAGETASGIGSFTYNGSALTAFTFTDVLNNNGSTGTFVYGLSDVHTDSINPGTGFSQLVMSLSTNAIAGTPSAFGNTSFTLAYSATNPGTGSTTGNGPNFQDITSGSVTLTQGTNPPATPEPATMGLAGMALSAGAIFLRRRRSC